MATLHRALCLVGFACVNGSAVIDFESCRERVNRVLACRSDTVRKSSDSSVFRRWTEVIVTCLCTVAGSRLGTVSVPASRSMERPEQRSFGMLADQPRGLFLARKWKA